MTLDQQMADDARLAQRSAGPERLSATMYIAVGQIDIDPGIRQASVT